MLKGATFLQSPSSARWIFAITLVEPKGLDRKFVSESSTPMWAATIGAYPGVGASLAAHPDSTPCRRAFRKPCHRHGGRSEGRRGRRENKADQAEDRKQPGCAGRDIRFMPIPSHDCDRIHSQLAVCEPRPVLDNLLRCPRLDPRSDNTASSCQSGASRLRSVLIAGIRSAAKSAPRYLSLAEMRWSAFHGVQRPSARNLSARVPCGRPLSSNRRAA